MTRARSSVLVFMLPEVGHLNPSFKIARALGARGHAVRYLTIPDLAGYVSRQGFEVEPFLPELFPEGAVERSYELGLVRMRREKTARFRRVLEAMLEGGAVRAQLRRLAPGLVITDITQPHMAFLARALGVPVVSMNVTLPQTKDGLVPPLRTAEPYRAGLRGALRAELSWAKVRAHRRLQAELASPLGMAPPYHLVRLAAPSFHVPAEALEVGTLFMPRLRGLSELVLCPRDFDFPRPPRDDLFYVESIDLDRREDTSSFPWDRIAADKPLLYCAMGSTRYRPKDVRRLVGHFVECLAMRPRWQGVVALGRYLSPRDLPPIPANVVVVSSAPQLAILRRAALMLTHGGLGSTKECIMHGAPMVMYPLDVDQPGNAARVEHHGLGLSGDVTKATREGLLAQLSAVLSDPSFAARCRVMRQRFLATEEKTLGADLAERALLAGQRASA